jgi:hypothetical protein
VSIEELAAMDAQYRETVRRRAIEETQRGIAIRAAQSADTSKLQRQLERLRGAA